MSDNTLGARRYNAPPKPDPRDPHRLIAVIKTLVALYPGPATVKEIKDEIALCGFPDPKYHSLRRTIFKLWRLGIVIRCPGRPARYFFCRDPGRHYGMTADRG